MENNDTALTTNQEGAPQVTEVITPKKETGKLYMQFDDDKKYQLGTIEDFEPVVFRLQQTKPDENGVAPENPFFNFQAYGKRFQLFIEDTYQQETETPNQE